MEGIKKIKDSFTNSIVHKGYLVLLVLAGLAGAMTAVRALEAFHTMLWGR